jgi:uncharacterized protein
LPGELDRDRDQSGRPKNARPRDELGRPLDRDDTGMVVEEPGPLPKPVALLHAQELLDAGRPFAAHEVLEAVWKQASGADRELWRGLAQIAVGITHALRGNEPGARTLLRRGSDSLTAFAGTTTDRVDVDGVRRWADAACADLSMTSRPPRLTRTPGQ